MKDIITSDDILGKKAVDIDGDILGIVIKLHIDNIEKKIVGITVDQGFMKSDLFVGIEFIQHFGVDAVMLNRYPLDKLKGMKVFTKEGCYKGFVSKVYKEENTLKGIECNKRFEKPIGISATEIEEIGNSIILKD